MKNNPVKTALTMGETVIGSEISRLRSADIPRIYAAAGFDFVFIDMEHTSFSLETVADMIQTARHWNIVPIVRVPQAEYTFVARVLDAGAQGIIVPRVNTPQQVEQLVSWVRYPPAGIRGIACTTAQTDGQPTSTEEFIASTHRETLLVIQIERREALKNLEQMLSFDEVDVACLGLMDLTVDLGIPGKTGHPKVTRAVQEVIDVAQQKKIAPGLITADRDVVHRWVSRGMRFISYATDEIMLQQAAADSVRKLRALCAENSPEQSASKNIRLA